MQEYLATLNEPYYVYFYISKDVIEKHFEEHKTWINLTFLIGWKDGVIQNIGEYLYGYSESWHPLMEYAEKDYMVETGWIRHTWLAGNFYFPTLGTFRAIQDMSVPIDQFVIEGQYIRLRYGSLPFIASLNYINKGYAFVELYPFGSFDIIYLPKVALKN